MRLDLVFLFTDHSFIENGHRQSDSHRRIVFDLDRPILVVSLDLIIDLDRSILECCTHFEMSVCSFVRVNAPGRFPQMLTGTDSISDVSKSYPIE
jgi:hypothetical protein